MNRPAAEIQVLNEDGKLETTHTGEDGPITIPVIPGKHQLKIQKKGFAPVTKDFEVELNRTKSIRIMLAPLKSPVAAKDLREVIAATNSLTLSVERSAAERVLALGGEVAIDFDYGHKLKAVSELPKRSFVVANIWLMDNRKVTDRDLPSFKGCSGMWLLGLDGTPESPTRRAGHHIGEYVSAPGLSELYLGSTGITDAGLADLADCTGIRQLWIFDSAVTDAGLQHLKRMNRLLHLRAQNTSVTEAGIRDLAAALPQCEINWDGGTIQPTLTPPVGVRQNS